MLDLVVFTTDPDRARAVMQGGAAAIFVDWENRDKELRQRGADTEINYHTVDDLRRIRAAITGDIICRVNALHAESASEIDLAIEYGATEVMLPMVRTCEEVESLLRMVNGRVRTGILVETVDACRIARQLGEFPLHRVYVGLNDLAIDTGASNIFRAVERGAIDAMRDSFRDQQFGFGGLTLPNAGYPIPCRLLLGEIMRLNCQFTFLRRSFWRDLGDNEPASALAAIHAAVAKTARRSPDAIAEDRAAFGQYAAR